MEALLILLCLWVFLLPLVAAIKAFSLQGKLDDLRRQLAQAHARLAKLENERRTPDATRTGEEAAAKVSASPPVEFRPREFSLPPVSPPEREPEPVSPPPLPPRPVETAPEKTGPPPLPVPSVARKRPELSLEQFIGKKVFAWVGGLALFIGILFFVKYAFERNLIPPAVRVAAGYVCGAGLVTGGWLKRRGAYAVLAQTLSATGILTLYGVTYAAHAVYDFPAFATAPAFAWMACVTALAIALAAATRAQVTAVLGMLGGFLTPVLLSTGEDRAVFLFSFLAILNAGILAVTRRHGWFLLAPLAAAGTAILEMAWVLRHFESGQYAHDARLLGVLGLLWLFPGMFLAGWRRKDPTPSGLAVVLLVFQSLLAGWYLTTCPGAGARPAEVFGCLLALPLFLVPPSLHDRRLRAAPSLAGYALFPILLTWLANAYRPEMAPATAVILLIYGAAHSGWAVRQNRLPEASASTGPDHPLKPPAPWAAIPSGAPAILLFGEIIQRTPPPHAGVPYPFAFLYTAWLLALAGVAGPALPTFRAVTPFLALAGALHFHLCRHFAFPPEQAQGANLLWKMLFALLFCLWPFATRARSQERRAPWIVAAMAPVAHFPLIFRDARTLWPDLQPGFIPLLCGVLPISGLLAVLRSPAPRADVRRSRVLWFSAAALTFVTLCVAVQWKREWLTLGLALEGLALLWLHLRIPHPGLRATAVALQVVAFVRLALNPAVLSYHQVAEKPWLAWHLHIYTLTAATMLLGARWLKPPHDLIGKINPRPGLQAGAGVLLFLMMNLQITEWFARPGDSVSLFAPGGFARGVTFTIAWGLYALALLALGFRVRLGPVRYAGIGLLGATLLKLFLIDLAGLESVYRIAAFIIVALIALAASFLYQRLSRDRTGEKPAPGEAP